MRTTLRRAERAHAVGECVEEILRGGFVREEEHARARSLFPDPGPRAGWLGRTLAALFLSTAIGLLVVVLEDVAASDAQLAWLVCAGLIVATEAVLAVPRLAFSGAAGTTAFWAWFALGAGLLESLKKSGAAWEIALPVLVLAGAAAAWRWGVPVHALLSTGALFVWLARMPQGRLLWVIAALVLVPLLARRLDRPAVPSHRHALAFAAGTAVCALFAALNVFAVREALVEKIGGRSSIPEAFWEPAAWLAMLLLPAGVLAWGVLSRRRWALVLGAAFVALSGLTFRRYVHLAPAWALLVLSGAVVALLAAVLMRLLGRRGEVAGFTDAALLTRPEREEALTAVALVASQIASAPAPAREEGSRFTAGGGDSGGGGASDRY